MTSLDYLIIGHGIAGAAMAYELRRRGHAVLVLDTYQPDSASNVAAGLMNPVAGQRFALTWRADELLTAASAFYQELGQHFGQPFFFEVPILKLFSSVQEQSTMLARRADNPWQDFVAEIHTEPVFEASIRQEFGGALIRRGGYVALRELLAALAAEGLQNGWLRRETFDPQQLVIQAGGVAYGEEVRARHIIFCEGSAATQNPYFNWLPLRPNQGEVLDVECAGLTQARVLNKGAYVVPLGQQRFRVGATYGRPPFAAGITEQARQELSYKLSTMTDQPFVVTGQRMGFRPTVPDRKPLVGTHPALPVVSICNGFGSKGVMIAPRLAAHFADVLEGTAELWPEVNIARYSTFYTASLSQAGFSS